MLALPFLYWCVDSMLGIQVAIILMLSTNLNAAFKLAFHGPRPYWYSPQCPGPGCRDILWRPFRTMPRVQWSYGASWQLTLRKWWSWLIAVLLILLIGISRLVSGRPLPARCAARLADRRPDRLAGAAVLGAGYGLGQKAEASAGRFCCAFLVSLVVILLPAIPFIWLKADKLAAATRLGHVRYTSHFIVKMLATVAGTFFGLLVGLIWLTGQGWFPDQRVMVETRPALSAGSGGCFYYQIWTEIYLPEGENVLAYFFALRALRGDWFLGNRWRAMGIYPVKLAEKQNELAITVS